MATNLVLYRTCSLRVEVSQDPLDQFSQSLHHIVGTELQMNDIRPPFFDILRDIAIATNLVVKMGQNYLPRCTYCSVIPKRNGISPRKYAH